MSQCNFPLRHGAGKVVTGEAKVTKGKALGQTGALWYGSDMAATAEAQTRRWTYEEYCRLEDQQRYEILDGQLIPMSPAPTIWHQKSHGVV